MRSDFRDANVYGPRQSPLGEAGVVVIFAHRLLQGQPLVINGDGLQTRDYVYVEDIAEANIAALERPDVAGVVILGTGVEISVTELFHQLAAVMGVIGEAGHGPPKHGEQRRSVLDIGRARRLLDWAPCVTLADGLRRTVEHLSQDGQVRISQPR